MYGNKQMYTICFKKGVSTTVGWLDMAKKFSIPSAIKKLEDQLTCPICLDQFANPRTLICLHSFCHKCLLALPLDPQEDKPILTCPTCRVHTELPQTGVAGLPIAFVANSLNEIHCLLKKVTDDQDISCDNCMTVNATGFCKQCTKCFCANCLVIHNKWVSFVDHVVISLDEVACTAFQSPSIKPEVTMNCSSHNRSLELYCDTCHEFICHNCTVRTHRGHAYDLVDDAYDRHRQTIESRLEPLREQIATLTEDIKSLIQKEKDVTQQGETVKEEIHGAVEQILLQSERKLAEDVDLAVRYKLSVLSQQKRKAETTLSQLMECFDFVQQGLKIGNPRQVLSEQSRMIDCISATESFKPESFKPLEQADVKLVKSKKIEEVHKSIGEVRYSSSCKVHKVNHYASMGKESTVIIIFRFPDGSSVPSSSSLISCYLIPPNNDQLIKCRVNYSVQFGSYNVIFTPVVRGLHQLHVRVNAMNIPNGSPLAIPVSLCPEWIDNPVMTVPGLTRPWGIDVTEDGLLIVSECFNYRIAVLDKERRRLKLFGSKGSKPGQFNFPSGVAITPNRTVLVGDSSNHRIQELTMEGRFIACVGGRGNGPLQFQYPRGIAINKASGIIFVADEDNHRIQVLKPDLTLLCKFGTKGSGKGQFNHPENLTLDSKGFVYVTDSYNHRIQKFTTEGRFVDMFGTIGSQPGQLSYPSGITMDSNGLLYVTETGNHRVSVFTSNGEFVHCFGGIGEKKGQLNYPKQLLFDKFGYLYICDMRNYRLVVY